jgi:heme-degrading monooxygenase HmoA
MENAPVITLRFFNIVPGANIEVWDRFNKWFAEVYGAMLFMKTQGATGSDFYRLIGDTPEYPRMGCFSHRENLSSWKAATETPEITSVQDEFITWEKRGVTESIWSAVYALIKSYRSDPALSGQKEDTRIENAPIMHLEAYRLSPENQEKYSNWFAEFGCKIFIPLFMRSPGLKGYDWFKFTGLARSKEVRDLEYPANLSVVYFENLPAFESFTKSPEQVAFQKALRTVFPRGLKYEWYVQYELTNSWRK